MKLVNITAVVCLLSAMPSMADKLKNTDAVTPKISAKQVNIEERNKHFYSLSYLKNINDFQLLNNDDVDVVTLEYGGKYAWGDSFIFFDRLHASADIHSLRKEKNYLEASARLSIPYLFNQPTIASSTRDKSTLAKYVKDYFVAGTVEYSYLKIDTNKPYSTTITNSLLGVGIAWQSDFFSYLNSNFYYANNEKQESDYQLTLTFAKSFTIAELAFKTNGYIDWSSAASDHKASFHFSPQVLLDLGKVFNQPKLVFVGVEYSYWRNKYGLSNVDDEHTVSAMVKLSF